LPQFSLERSDCWLVVSNQLLTSSVYLFRPVMTGRRMKNNQSVTASVCRTLTRVSQLGRRSVRDSQRYFWIEGIRHFVQAYDANYAFDEVVYSPILLKSPLVEMLVRRLGAASVKRVRVSPEQFRSISKDARASGIGAIVRQQWTTLEQADATIGLCWMVIEDLRSPGNLGTILRTAEAVGAAGVVFLGKACDPFDPVVLRASMGGVFHLSLVSATPHELQLWLEANRVQLVGLSPEATCPWTDLPAAQRVALAIGEERRGLSSQLRGLCHSIVRLPMVGRADSLNAGVAASVMLYELVRREGGDSYRLDEVATR
jgi:RNA methyltransferase, TrmH family